MLSRRRRREPDLKSSGRSLHRDKTEIGEIAKDSAEFLLDATVELSGALPLLQTAAKSLQVIVKRAKKMVKNKDDIRKLEDYILQLTNFTADSEGEVGGWCRASLYRTLDDVTRQLQSLLDHNIVRWAVEASKVEETIKDSVIKVEQALNKYELSLTQDTHRRIVRQTIDEENIILDKLDRAKDAVFDASDIRPHCLPGTRVDIRKTLQDWAANTNVRCIYWLNGIAGSGKTTIAQSFAEFLSRGEKLCASFFCSRTSTQRSDCKLIFPTIAFQLAFSNLPGRFEYRGALLDALRMNLDIASLSLRRQIEELIVIPVERSRISAVIVIDALDECKETEAVSRILQLLSEFASRISTIKWFISSRPEQHIRDKFRHPSLHPITATMILHEVDAISVGGDIRRFLDTSLGDIPDLQGPLFEEDVNHLTERSAGLFIFASTAVKFITDTEGHPRDCLLQILDQSPMSRVSDQANPYQDLDALYLDVLRSASTRTNPRRIRDILGLLTIAEEPLSADVMAGLLSIESTVVMSSLRGLHSILLVPDSPTEPITFHHTSLVDFLTSRTRCTNAKYLVCMRYEHFKLASRCVELLEDHLDERDCICNAMPPTVEAGGWAQGRTSGSESRTISRLPHTPRPRQYCPDHILYCCGYLRAHSYHNNPCVPFESVPVDVSIWTITKFLPMAIADYAAREYRYAIKVVRWMRDAFSPSRGPLVRKTLSPDASVHPGFEWPLPMDTDNRSCMRNLPPPRNQTLGIFHSEASGKYNDARTVTASKDPMRHWTGLDTLPAWISDAMFFSMMWLFVVSGLILMLCTDSDLPELVGLCMLLGLVSVAFALRWGRTFYLLRYRPGKNTYVMAIQGFGFLVILPLRYFVGGICFVCYVSSIAALDRSR